MGGLDEPDEGFADPAHGLRIGRVHGQHAPVVEDILGGHGLGPNATLGERHVLGDRRVEVMADHEHVEVLGERVDRIRACRVRG